MDIPTHLTPFSHSILHPAQEHALARLARACQIVTPTIHPANPAQIRGALAQMAIALWRVPPFQIEHILAAELPENSPRGKGMAGNKLAQQFLKTFPSAYARLRKWAQWVFASEWSQAQLLQVMEEIEPMAAEALFWVDALAMSAAGSYTRLGELVRKKEKDPNQGDVLLLGLVAGLETPDSRLIQTLTSDITPQELSKRFGHHPLGQEGEIARPRIADMAPSMVTPVEVWNWDLVRAQERQVDATRQALAQAGMLGRSGLRKTLELTQRLLIAHAEARDALAYVLAAARHWAQAAAAEGAEDNRIHHEDEIFMLEIEEIKQMMTGEWHSRDHVEVLIFQRQRDYENTSPEPQRHDRPLGVAGYDTEGDLMVLSPSASLSSLTAPDGFIALAEAWRPAWWQALVRAEGIIDLDGHALSWAASVARSGDLPALMGGGRYEHWREPARIRLDPARHRAEMWG